MRYITLNIDNEYIECPVLDQYADVLFCLGNGRDPVKNLAFRPSHKLPNEFKHLFLVPIEKWQLFNLAFREGGLSFWGSLGQTSGVYRDSLLKYGGKINSHKAIFESGSNVSNWRYFGVYDSVRQVDISNYTSRISSLIRYGSVFLEMSSLLGDPDYLVQMQVSDSFKISGECFITVSANKSTPGGKAYNTVVQYLKANKNSVANRCKGEISGNNYGGGLSDCGETRSTLSGSKINNITTGAGAGIVVIETRKITAGFIVDQNNSQISNNLKIKANGGSDNNIGGGGGFVYLSFETMEPDITIEIEVNKGSNAATNGWIEVIEKGEVKVSPIAGLQPSNYLKISTVGRTIQQGPLYTLV